MFRCRAGVGEVGDRLKGAARRWDDVVAPATSRSAGRARDQHPGSPGGGRRDRGRGAALGQGRERGRVRPARTTNGWRRSPRSPPTPCATPGSRRPGPAGRGYHPHPRDQPRDRLDARSRPGAPVGRQPGLEGTDLRPRRGGALRQGQCEIRAVAGQDTVDPKDPGLQDLIARAGWAAGRGETLYLSDRDEPTSDAERMFLTIFGPDLETAAVSSGLYLPLKDEEGILGVLVFESGTAGLRHRAPARAGRYPGQPDGGGAPERAALQPGADGGRHRRHRRQEAGVAGLAPAPGADLRRHHPAASPP